MLGTIFTKQKEQLKNAFYIRKIDKEIIGALVSKA